MKKTNDNKIASIAHIVQTATDNDARAIVLSIDGVGAFGLISCRAMMTALHRMPGGDSILPFVLQFYGRPSTHLWEDENGTVHEIQQGEREDAGSHWDNMAHSAQSKSLCNFWVSGLLCTTMLESSPGVAARHRDARWQACRLQAEGCVWGTQSDFGQQPIGPVGLTFFFDDPSTPSRSRRPHGPGTLTPLFHGAQLAVDHDRPSSAQPKRRCSTTDGAALDQARRRKELRYPELTGEHGRARLVVLAWDGQMRRMTSSSSWRGRGFNNMDNNKMAKFRKRRHTRLTVWIR